MYSAVQRVDSAEFASVYPPLRQQVRDYLRHPHFGTDFERKQTALQNLSGSEGAGINFFLPLILDPLVAARVLRAVKPDIAKIDSRYLINGICFDYYSRKNDYLNERPGGERTKFDIAIAYRGQNGELRLWVVDCRITEQSFRVCPVELADCDLRINCSNVCQLREDFNACYLHTNGYRYWNMTDRVFALDRVLQAGGECPFRDGKNELWRKQLMAQAIEDDPDRRLFEVKRVTYSVMRHPLNDALRDAIAHHQQYLRLPTRFFDFDFRKLLDAARKESSPFMRQWINWIDQAYPQDKLTVRRVPQ